MSYFEWTVAGSKRVKRLRGCLPAALVGVVGIILVAIIVIVLAQDRSIDSPDLGLDPDQTPAASTAPASTGSAQPTPDDSSIPVTTGDPASDGAAGGPPAAESLPAGAILVKGRSGGPIGYIASDGQFRFLSLKSPGVVVGDPTSTNTPWTQNGQVLEFGARLSGANQGRYGVNLYIDGTTYGPGVALEVGQRSAVTKFDGNGPLQAGQELSIIVGEAGNLAEKGDNSLQWWFVFQPDAAAVPLPS